MNEFYQGIKPEVMKVFALSKDAIHIHVGFLAFIISFIVLKKHRYTWKVLILPVTLSIVMELMDASFDYARIQKFFWSAYAHDIINTNFIPVILFFVLNKVRR